MITKNELELLEMITELKDANFMAGFEGLRERIDNFYKRLISECSVEEKTYRNAYENERKEVIGNLKNYWLNDETPETKKELFSALRKVRNLIFALIAE